MNILLTQTHDRGVLKLYFMQDQANQLPMYACTFLLFSGFNNLLVHFGRRAATIGSAGFVRI